MMNLSEIDDIDVKVALIQALIPEGLKAVNEKLQAEVKALAAAAAAGEPVAQTPVGEPVAEKKEETGQQ